MKIVILGGGPAGLYAGLLIKKAAPTYDITILERNPPDVTYGWGVVFSDRTLSSFQRADYKTYEQIASQFVIWDSIDTWYRGDVIRCGGHVIASISRKLLLGILQQRCLELGIDLRFRTEINDLAELPPYNLLIAADGLNSLVRRAFAGVFQPQITLGKAKYIWLGAEKVLDAFTFIFRENEHGLFQVHAYPFSGTTSTFIVECAEATWLNAGLDQADEAASLAYCERLLSNDLGNARLLSNNSKWISFPTLKTRHWRHGNIVLLGDSAHTAHFSIGSGTKLAMEDAIALAGALEQHRDLDTALNAYELERKPVVETFQRAAQESQSYFETLKRYLGLEPMQFTFQLLTRSGRITYDDLKLRDARFGDAVDRWMIQQSAEAPGSQRAPEKALANEAQPRIRKLGFLKRPTSKGDLTAARPQARSYSPPIVAPPPALTPFRLRALTLPNRVIVKLRSARAAEDGILTQASHEHLLRVAERGSALVMTDLAAVSAQGRITPADAGLYESSHQATWAQIIEQTHTRTPAKLGLQLGHAGRRGAARPRDTGLDRPLREGAWPLLSASPLPYTAQSQTPKAMDRDDIARVRGEFAQAAQMAGNAGFDWLHLNFSQGYLLASFLSPLSNKRADEYGGSLENRLRFPLEVFDAVRAAWPEDKPLSIALTVSDCAKDGLGIDRGVMMAQTFREHGCDMIEVLAGQTVPDAEPTYGRGFLTSLSDRIRNEAGIATMVGGYLTTSDEVNTILAAGRADLCIMEQAE